MSRILNKIRSNYFGYSVARKILTVPFFVNNPVYVYFYARNVKRTAKSLEKNLPGIDIGITNACNSNCIMCPHSKLKKIGFMGMKLYKKIINNCSDLGIKSVVISFFGEPLLDKNIFEKISYAKSKGIAVGFYTNASLLSKEVAYRLIKSGLSGFIVSIDANNRQTYEKIRRGLKFDIVKKNILNFVKIRNKMGLVYPKISLVFAEQKENKNEIKEFYNQWSKYVDNIAIQNLGNWAGDIGEVSPDSFHFKSGLKRWPCKLLWQRMVIDWNGDVVLCCNDWNHSVVLGNLNYQRIEDIWFGEKLNKIRKMHMDEDFKSIPICYKCNKKTVWWL